MSFKDFPKFTLVSKIKLNIAITTAKKLTVRLFVLMKENIFIILYTHLLF